MDDTGVLERSDLEWWAKHGVVGGLVGGLAFLAYEIAFAVLMRGPSAFVAPLRTIGAILLGPRALEPSYPTVQVVLAGLVVHAMFSALFGGIFAALAWTVPALRESALVLVTAATAYGLGLWAVDRHVIAPWAGWGWVPARDMPLMQVLAHMFAFGTVLGVYLARAAAHRRPLVERRALSPPLRRVG